MNASHFYWKHFWWGLAIGADLGAWIGFHEFLSRLVGLGLTIAVALFLGLCSGIWGDEFWSGLINP